MEHIYHIRYEYFEKDKSIRAPIHPVVQGIKSQGEREITDNSRRLQCHYGFDSNFCNPAAGHEKGSVENYVGYSRRNYFVPVPQMDNLEAYNCELLKAKARVRIRVYD